MASINKTLLKIKKYVEEAYVKLHEAKEQNEVLQVKLKLQKLIPLIESQNHLDTENQGVAHLLLGKICFQLYVCKCA